MKNFILIFVISTFSITISSTIAQRIENDAIEQILILESGMLLKGEVSILDKKTLQFSKEDYSLVIKRKNVRLTLPGDIFSDSDKVEAESLVILKSNSWLKAQIIELTQHSVVLTSNGVTSIFPTSEILKIYPAGQDVDPSSELLEKADIYEFVDLSSLEQEESRIYNITYLNIPLGLRGNKDSQFKEKRFPANIGVQHTVGYKFNQYFGLGLHLGYAVFEYQQNSAVCGLVDCTINSFFRDLNISAIYSGIDVRGELSKKKLNPYYNIGFGFHKTLRGRGLNLDIDRLNSIPDFEFDKDASKAKLGWQVFPAIGVQANMKSMKLLIDFGFQVVNANVEDGMVVFREDGRFRSMIQKATFSDFVLRVGLML